MPDYPDGVQVVMVAVTVEGYPVIPGPLTEVAAGNVGRYSGTSTSYQPVASWTVATGKTGKLSSVGLKSNNYAKTNWQLAIAGSNFLTNIVIGGALTLPFNEVTLAAGAVVTLSAKSVGGVSIIADGAIVGKEVG